MTDYVGGYEGKGHNQREARALADQLHTHATITEGVIRWNSNNSVIPEDCVALAVHIGLPVDAAKCERARDVETRLFLEEYREHQRNRRVTAEEMFELRATHGRGKKVVNMITGRVTRT
jgi:hypothetical protein